MSRVSQSSHSGQQNGHSSRRDHNSVSSQSSASARSERAKHSPAVESAVTRLLVSIKQLLEALTLWSQLKMDEEGVSNVYVRLGNDFNSAVAAFGQFEIRMDELLSVPDDLRNVLEQCLAEDATPEHLELYLPTVRQIITNLLQGLRGKQSIYRRIVSDGRHKSGGADHDRGESRSSRTSASSRREGHRSQGSQHGDVDGSGGENTARRSAASSSRARSNMTGSPRGNDFVGGFAPSIMEHPVGQRERSPDMQRTQSNDYFNAQRRLEKAPSMGTTSSSPSTFSTPLQDPQDLPDPNHRNNPTPVPDDIPADKRATSPPPVPANVTRYSLVDKPVERVSSPSLTPSIAVEPSSPHNATPTPEPASPPASDPLPIEPPPPAVAQSLAALKSNDVLLERRASKRFSVYNISKMTGAATSRERSLRGNNQSNRRSMAATGNLTPNELAVLTEVDDEEPSVISTPDTKLRRMPSRSNTPDKRVPAVPPLPMTPSRTPEPAPTTAESSQTGAQSATDPSRITIFLQLGREVKKVVVEPGITFASLRVLFVDKFSYNPGLDNFPAIYIRDPASGVQYELEDTDDVKGNCLLSLNIEPLDQIKQHIDAQISNLSNDIKELRSAVTNNNRQSSHFPDITAQPLAESTPAARPTDKQFLYGARRVSVFMGGGSHSSPFSQNIPVMPPIPSQPTGQSLQAQMTGGSMLSEYTGRVVNDLKTQFDEVQNLRRDLGIMRQLYTQFMTSTKESLGALRTQTANVKALANSNVGGARAYIDSGKQKLDVRSQNVLTEVEKLQDTIESVKDDVIKRHVTPNALYFKNIRKDLDAAHAELTNLAAHITTVKPMWKKTWEEELQNIVEEQQFLTHQEEFLADLMEDYKAMVEVYGHVEKVVTLRRPAAARGGRGGSASARTFRPPPRDEGHDGLSTVMLEIKGAAAVDPERRLKAIEASQKNREKVLAARADDMHLEIQDFVSQRKLKLTGGAEEAERVRQKRNEMTIKAMFNGGEATGGPSFGVVETSS